MTAVVPVPPVAVLYTINPLAVDEEPVIGAKTLVPDNFTCGSNIPPGPEPVRFTCSMMPLLTVSVLIPTAFPADCEYEYRLAPAHIIKINIIFLILIIFPDTFNEQSLRRNIIHFSGIIE
jgi:hypothetical protein